ncbi:MAG TPA: hypothetical protein VEV82_08745 [Actinomycetota bacterium]|nr:hypothetical protein [Actinomycetota bacterium]
MKSNGDQADGHSFNASISGSGQFVVFESQAENLVPNDDNMFYDVFVYNRNTGKIRRVSVRSNGNQLENGDSFEPSISASGRFVAFESEADDLVGNDDNLFSDAFVHDRKTGKTRRVSVRSNGAEAGALSQDVSISANGRFVAFSSGADDLVPNDVNGQFDIFVHDRKTGKTKRVSVHSNGDQGELGGSFDTGVSGKGRWVIFESEAENLVSDDDNGYYDIFVHDRETKKTIRVSVKNNGDQAELDESYDPYISKDGRLRFSPVTPTTSCSATTTASPTSSSEAHFTERSAAGGRNAFRCFSIEGRLGRAAVAVARPNDPHHGGGTECFERGVHDIR